jgi:hypothetical protein
MQPLAAEEASWSLFSFQAGLRIICARKARSRHGELRRVCTMLCVRPFADPRYVLPQDMQLSCLSGFVAEDST